MSKYEDTRIVTFKEDYGVPKLDKGGKPIVIDGKTQMTLYYKKDSQHAIHFKVVKKLEDRGAKMSVELFDRKGYLKKQQEKRLKSEKGLVSVERR